jgi:hypothetical protein
VPYVLGLILLGLAVVAASVLMSFLVRHGDRYPMPAEPRQRLKRADAPLHPRSPTERWLFPDE